MKKIIFLLCLNFALISCFKKNRDAKKESIDKAEIIASNKKIELEHFKDLEEFKKFIIGKKWVDLADESPCHEFSQSITLKDGYIHEYNTIEPSRYKVDTIIQIDSKTLGIKIKSDFNRDILFKVEVLNLEKRLVKWMYHYETEYEARPYEDVCSEEKVSLYDKPTELEFPSEIWFGEYYFEENEAGKVILIKKDSITYEATGMRYYAKHQLISKQVADTLALYFHRSISDVNNNLDMYLPLIKLYKKNDKYFIKTILTNEEWKETEIEKF